MTVESTFPRHYLSEDDFEIFYEYHQSTGFELIRLTYSEIPDDFWLSILIPQIDHRLAHRVGIFSISKQIGLVVSKAKSPSERLPPNSIRTKQGRSHIILPGPFIGYVRHAMFALCSTQAFGEFFNLGSARHVLVGQVVGPSIFAAAFANPGAMYCLNFAIRTTQMALFAICDHELGHIKNGHLDLLIAKGATAGQKRALEFDADAFACNMGFGDAFSSIGHTHSYMTGQEGPMEPHGFATPQEALVALMAVQYAVFRLFPKATESDDAWAGPHPPAVFRSLICSGHFRSNLSARSHDDLLEHYDDLQGSVIEAVEKGLKELGIPPPHLVNMTALDAYHFEIGRFWNEIRDDLDQLKLGGSIADFHDLGPRLSDVEFCDQLAAARALEGWPR